MIVFVAGRAVELGDVFGSGVDELAVSRNDMRGAWRARFEHGEARVDRDRLVETGTPAGDVDGDGRGDLVTYVEATRALHVLRSATSEEIGVVSEESADAGNESGWGWQEAHDLDGDGRADLLGIREQTVYTDEDPDGGRGEWHERFVTEVVFVPGSTLRGNEPLRRRFRIEGLREARSAVGDFDGDGVEDLALASEPHVESWDGEPFPPEHHGPWPQGSLLVRLYAGGPEFGLAQPREVTLTFSLVPHQQGPRLVSVGDVNGDGIDDLGVRLDCSFAATRLYLFRGGVSGFSPMRALSGPCTDYVGY